MDASCMQLSIEGERLLKAQDYHGAIEFFEAGLEKGTEDLEVLSAVYNQLGNACFYVGRFHKALEYHQKDLEIAKKLNDRQGQAKAYGNLGNTFKSLKKFSEAIKCCENHLRITRDLDDRLGEGRACYNLGNVHHAVGKGHLSRRKTDPEAKPLAYESINKAIKYYEETLTITAELNDTAGEGRAVGNLGNAYTAIGNYQEAIKHHRRRLDIANDANDLPAKARACGNLGNAYSALGQFSEALKYYQQSLSVSKDAGNVAGEGQAYYCLGSTYTHLKNHVKAIEFHEKHVEIAKQLKDSSSELRGYYNLRNAHHALGENPKAAHYHQLIQKMQPDKAKKPLPKSGSSSQQPQKDGQSGGDLNGGRGPAPVAQYQSKTKPSKKEKKEKKKKTKVSENAVQAFHLSDSDSDDDDIQVTRKGRAGVSKTTEDKGSTFADAWLTGAIEEVKNGNFTKQNSNEGKSGMAYYDEEDPTTSNGTALPSEDFFDMLLEAQNSGLENQRAAAPGSAPATYSTGPSSGPSPPPFIGASHSAGGGGGGGHSSGINDGRGGDDMESFFDMLAATENKFRNSRLSEQRSDPHASRQDPKALEAKLDADNMSFFEMLEAAK